MFYGKRHVYTAEGRADESLASQFTGDLPNCLHPGPRLPCQLQNITATWLVPTYMS